MVIFIKEMKCPPQKEIKMGLEKVLGNCVCKKGRIYWENVKWITDSSSDDEDELDL